MEMSSIGLSVPSTVTMHKDWLWVPVFLLCYRLVQEEASLMMFEHGPFHEYSTMSPGVILLQFL